jgi:uncharacterized protein
MQVTLTGATGLVGGRLVAALRARGDEITVLTRDPDRARAALGPGVEAVRWDPTTEPAPAAALADREGVVHLAGETLTQRWTAETKRRIIESREIGTRNLVEGLRAADPRPSVLVASSAVGYYGPHGAEPLDERTPPGRDFLAEVCVVWEREADAAGGLHVRVVKLRQGVVLTPEGGALKTMLPFFKAGVGGPVAGGRQYMPWIHPDDVAGMFVRALEDQHWAGAINATAPRSVTNRELSHALGHAINRPTIAPVPAFAVRLLYGEMSEMVTKGQNVVARRARELGFEWRHPEIEEALRAALA